MKKERTKTAQRVNRPIMFLLTTLLLVLAMSLSACGAAKEQSPSIEEKKMEDTTKNNEPVDPEDNVKIDELNYPNAEYLFEVPGLGGPMMPWRFFATDASIDDAVAFYSERIAGFDVERDEMVEGYRHFMVVVYPSPMDALEVDSADELPEVGQKLDGAIIGLEIVNSTAHAEQFGRLKFTADSHGFPVEISPNTTIIIIEYFNNPY